MKKALIAGACLMAAVIGLVALNAFQGDGQAEAKPKKVPRRIERGRSAASKDPAETVRNAIKGINKDAKPRKRPPIDIFANLIGKDRTLAEKVQSALDQNDIDATLAATKGALASTNGEVRLGAVEALSWFGADALPELTSAMADSDERVADAAERAWELALNEIDDASRKFSIATAAMSILSDKNHLASISGLLESAALEVIDSEDDPDKSAEARIAVVQALVDIMDSGSENGAAQAKDAYEGITGFKWISIDEAEIYLQDPEEYDLP